MSEAFLMWLLKITLRLAALWAHMLGARMPGPLPVHVPARIDPADIRLTTEEVWATPAHYGCTAWRNWRMGEPQ